MADDYGRLINADDITITPAALLTAHGVEDDLVRLTVRGVWNDDSDPPEPACVTVLMTRDEAEQAAEWLWRVSRPKAA